MKLLTLIYMKSLNTFFCIVEATSFWLYQKQKKGITFLQAYPQDSWITLLQTVQQHSPCEIHLFDQTTAQLLTIEKKPSILNVFDGIQWLRSRYKYLSGSSSYSWSHIFYIKGYVMSVGLQKPLGIQVLEEKLSNSSVSLIYHSYAFEIARSLNQIVQKKYTAPKAFFAIQRASGPLLIALFSKGDLQFLRVLNTSPSDSIPVLAHQTKEYLGQMEDLTQCFICACGDLEKDQEEWFHFFPGSFFLAGPNFDYWLKEHCDQGPPEVPLLDRLLLYTEKRNYLPLRPSTPKKHSYPASASLRLAGHFLGWGIWSAVILEIVYTTYDFYQEKKSFKKTHALYQQLLGQDMPLPLSLLIKVKHIFQTNEQQALRIDHFVTSLEKLLGQKLVLNSLHWDLEKSTLGIENWSPYPLPDFKQFQKAWQTSFPKTSLICLQNFTQDLSIDTEKGWIVETPSPLRLDP